MCACIPLVWLTQPAALSQGCLGRAGDLHPPSTQIGSSLARNPKMGKAIDAVGRVAVSAAGVWLCYALARFWKLTLANMGFAFAAYPGEGQSTKSWRFTQRLDGIRSSHGLPKYRRSKHKNKTKSLSEVSRLDPKELKEGKSVKQSNNSMRQKFGFNVRVQ